MTVWLVERHALPIVSIRIAVPAGSSSDPKGEAGLAFQAAGMLDEGAGALGALDFAQAVNQLGATFATDATLDISYAQLGVMKRDLAAGMKLLGDAVVRPRFEAKEWKRVHDLWMNDLKERASDPVEVARVVEKAVLYGSDHPYGHPVDGLLASAPKVTLAEAKRFYTQAWRPDRAVLVAVGDLTREELDAQITAAFKGWKTPATPPLPVVTPPPPVGPGKTRLIFVERPDAPQAVIQVARAGVAVDDPRYAPLDRANLVVGGTFTSRINTDLREKRGWTYGAFSSVSKSRGVGTVTAGGAFVTEHAVEALKALLGDLDDFAHGGMSEAEAAKTKVQARAELVSAYETIQKTAQTLGMDAALGLSPDWEAKSSAAADAVDRDALVKLATPFYPSDGTTIVIVGSRAKLEDDLRKTGVAPIESYDAEGNPATSAPSKASEPSEPKEKKK
jgi:predicted Zn-dependent peptidase